MEALIKKVDTVLVPTDFTSVSDVAIKQAVEVLKAHNGHLTLLHVQENKNDLTSDLEVKLAEYSSKFEYSNIELIVQIGDIFNTINQVSNDKNVDLIIMGTHGKKGMQKLLGSNVLKVIDSTKIPFIITQNKVSENGFSNILFPVSLHDEDRQKVSYTVRIAKMFNSKVHIFPRFEANKNGEKQMINTILQIKAVFNKYEVNFEVAPLLETKDNFQKKTLDYAEKINADLIMIVSDSSNHLPLLGAKEEDLLFNDLQIPILCMEERKTKHARFSTYG